jgi:predicted transcriptional regulator
MEKTTVYLDEIDYRRLKRVAAKRRVAPASLLREAVAEYVARHDTPKRARSLGAFRSGRGDLAEKTEALLRGFGEGRR